MNKLVLFFTIFILSTNTTLFAEQVITLKDGSQIKGELSGIDNGVYTVKTPIIGDVHVAAGDVSSITNGNVPAPAQPTSNTASIPTGGTDQMAAIQQKLMSNPQAMSVLQQMAQDPEVMQALQDPALVQAVTSHDYQAIQNNPKIQEMMNTPKMQAYLKQLAAQQQQQAAPAQ